MENSDLPNDPTKPHSSTYLIGGVIVVCIIIILSLLVFFETKAPSDPQPSLEVLNPENEEPNLLDEDENSTEGENNEETDLVGFEAPTQVVSCQDRLVAEVEASDQELVTGQVLLFFGKDASREVAEETIVQLGGEPDEEQLRALAANGFVTMLVTPGTEIMTVCTAEEYPAVKAAQLEYEFDLAL